MTKEATAEDLGFPGELNTWDWQHIFETYLSPQTNPRTRKVTDVRYRREQVKRILGIVDGENDGADWLGAFEMNDGTFLAVRAGCDYTGWDCQAGGSCDVAATEGDLIAFCLTLDERARLNLMLPANDNGDG